MESFWRLSINSKQARDRRYSNLQNLPGESSPQQQDWGGKIGENQSVLQIMAVFVSI